MGETAEHAVLREVWEKLGIVPKIVRPLWLNQGFYTEDVDKLRYHELCIYFLMDVSETKLSENDDKFTRMEDNQTHIFEWLEFDRLKHEYFYPLFLKKGIFSLPKELELRTETE